MKRLVFLIFFFLIFSFSAAAREAEFITEQETAFKKIGAQWLKFEEESSKNGMAPEWVAIQLKKIREDFKTFALENPETSWTDDAYFFAAALESARAKSLEGKLFLIENYPEASAEEWTRYALSFALPVIEPLDAGVRMDVCLEYLKAGMKRELQMLAIESAEKYPQLGTQFEVLVLEPETKTNSSKENL